MNQADNSLRFTVESSPTSIGLVTERLDGFCAELGVDDDVRHNLVVAVDEAVTNIIVHAYRDIADGVITITFSFDEGNLRIELLDEGEKFYEHRIPQEKPTIDLEGDQLGGFGLFLMQRLMDHLAFEHDEDKGTNRLVMEKKLVPKQA